MNLHFSCLLTQSKAEQRKSRGALPPSRYCEPELELCEVEHFASVVQRLMDTRSLGSSSTTFSPRTSSILTLLPTGAIAIAVSCVSDFRSSHRHRRYVPAGKSRLEKTVHLATPAPRQGAEAPEETQSARRTLREILGGFMQVPFHSVVAGKM